MGIYSENSGFNEELGLDMDTLVESFLIDDLSHNYSKEAIQEFCAEGGVADALLEAKVLSNKRTIVRLSKKDDMKRRSLIACIQLAKQNNDPLYTKLIKQRIAWKQTRAKLFQKYSHKGEKAALIGQKEYVKKMKGVNLSNSGNAAFITKDDNR